MSAQWVTCPPGQWVPSSPAQSVISPPARWVAQAPGQWVSRLPAPFWQPSAHRLSVNSPGQWATRLLASSVGHLLSFLPALSNICEKIVYTQLLSYLSSCNALSPYRCAYRKCHSTEDALMDAVEWITRRVDTEQLGCVVKQLLIEDHEENTIFLCA